MNDFSEWSHEFDLMLNHKNMNLVNLVKQFIGWSHEFHLMLNHRNIHIIYSNHRVFIKIYIIITNYN